MSKISKIRDGLKNLGKNRIFLLIFLILILTGLCIYHVENFRQHQDYPSIADVLSSYPEGQMVSLSGAVTEIFPGGFKMVESYQHTLVEFTVYSPEKVSLKDEVFVLGVLMPNNQIISQKMLITTEGNFSFVLVRSFLALLVLFLIFNHYWKFNRKEWIFVRRK